MQWKCSRVAILVAMLCLLVAGCEKAPGDFFQGYVEGEFVYVSSPLAGTVQKLFVSRGDQVQAGQPLFALDETMEKAAREQAQAAFTMAEADFKREEQLFRQDRPQRRSMIARVRRAIRTVSSSRRRNGISNK